MRYSERVRLIADSLTAELSAEETVMRFVNNMGISFRIVDYLPQDGAAEGINGIFDGVIVASEECLDREGIGRDSFWRVVFHELAHQTGLFIGGRQHFRGGIEQMVAETAAFILTTKFNLPIGNVKPHFNLYKAQMKQEGTLTVEDMNIVNDIAREAARMILQGSVDEA